MEVKVSWAELMELLDTAGIPGDDGVATGSELDVFYGKYGKGAHLKGSRPVMSSATPVYSSMETAECGSDGMFTVICGDATAPALSSGLQVS